MQASDTQNFYQDIPGISSFRMIADIQFYEPLPDDWLVIATDIRNSTEAIASGKYRAVNMAGASAIAAILNDFPDLQIPFVFGGEGVTIAMPDVGTDHIMGLLKFCREAVREIFGLELAAGCRYMSELRKEGKEIKLGKFKISEYANQAIFWGDGVDYVEEVVKASARELDSVTMIEGDFSGLECRWNSIPSGRDEVLSIIIKSVIEDEQERSRFYKRCFEKIERIYGQESDYAPVSADNLSLTLKPALLGGETNLRSYPSKFWKKLLYYAKLYYTQFAGGYLMKNKIETKNTRWGDYKPDFVKNADFRKFSDGLKLVISGTVHQRNELRKFLMQQFSQGKAAFGTHASPASLTTCYVTDYQSKHVHFIDGTDGGYASASVELKQQLIQLRKSKTLFK